MARGTKAPSSSTTGDADERYQAFIRNSNEGIWRFEVEQPIPINLPPKEQIDLMFRHAYLAEANEAMAAMYGLDSIDQIIGARLGDFMIRDDPQNIDYLTAFITSDYRLAGAESHEVDKEGADKYFINSLVGVVEDGYLVRAWGTQSDVTNQRISAQALQKSEERLGLALEASDTGIWEWDIKNDKLTWSDKVKENYGLKPSDKVDYKRYRSLIHPEDRAHMRDVVANALKTGERYREEHRITWPDKSVHWVLAQGRAYLDKGKPVRMIGTSMIIDKRKRIDELEDLNRRLKLQQDQLVELNNSKDDFISLASHQLRTPATGVKQYIGMLLEGYGGKLSAEQIKMLQTAYESNERQLHIIDDLLKVAHLDAGKVTLKKERTDLVPLIMDVISEQADKFKQRKQKVKFTHPAKLSANIDPERMRMVIENLIDNATKYTPDGKAITIQLNRTPKHITISVKDQGVGIAKKDLPRLFQKFSRVSNSLSTLVGGTGLGLYWVEKIVSLHDGTITINSRPHHGSTFTITLPRKKIA